MATKVNFTLPEDLVLRLKSEVAERSRSAFVADAVARRLAELDRERIEADMIEGYKARYEEDMALNAEMEAATLEGWPEYDEPAR